MDKQITELKAFRDIGETFSYLGRTCVVTGHSYCESGDAIPMLRFDYADNHGVIHEDYATMNELPVLIKQNQT